jgi:secreted trypsin-like serine protease
VTAIFASLATVLLVAGMGCSEHRATSGATLDAWGDGIIGGRPVSSDEPIAASTALLLNMDHGSFCTASILNSQWLVTAAHCFADHDPKAFLIVFKGSYADLKARRIESSNLARVAEVKIHPRYQFAMNELNEIIHAARREGRELKVADLEQVRDWGDIAVFKADHPIPSGKVPAVLMAGDESLKPGHYVTIAGYGQRAVGPRPSTGELYKVDVALANVNYSSTEVLAENKGRGACHGDSGGPAYTVLNGRLYLFGIISHGIGGAGECDSSTVYTNAAKYTSWIQKYVNLRLAH